MHPDIVCFHGTRSIPPYESGTVPDMTPEDFVKGLRQCSIATGDQKMFGAVHGFYGTLLKRSVESEGGRFGAVLRHPIRRIHSNFVLSYGAEICGKDVSDVDVYRVIKDKRLDVVDVLVNDSVVNLSPVEKAFYHYCKSFMYFGLDCIRECNDDAVWRMEDITSCKESFRRMFCYITGDLVEYTGHYESMVFSVGKINKHVADESFMNIFDAWPDAFKFLFRQAIVELGGEQVIDTYMRFGYDLPDILAMEFIARGGRIILDG